MSATILQRCVQDGSIDLAELADLMCLASHSVYPYLTDRQLRYSQFRAVFRRCGDPRVRHAFLNDLLPGLGLIVSEVDTPLDVDGDGDVDTDDALQAALQTTQAASSSARSIFESAADRRITEAELHGLNDLLGEVITQAVQARRVVNYIGEQQSRRRKARPLPGTSRPRTTASNGKAVMR